MIFADTSYFYAGLVARDQRHEQAQSLTDLHSGQTIATTNLVLGECWTLLNSRWGHATAERFLKSARQSRAIESHHVSPDLEAAAFEWLCRHDERIYSFVDATSFAFMRENRITKALAFDGDFTAAGFIELRP
jgi:predicted nucleic acid-binding protein